jgi:6-phosphogluconolactonase/glucosamine-6-phosphate isomerase/deaminase
MIDYIYADQPAEKAAEMVVVEIKKHLAKGEQVLCLLSGGSGIAVAVEADKKLAKTDLSNLFVSLTDERYGELGRKDENWQQLLDVGFSLTGANLYRPLNGKDMRQTTADFNDWLTKQFKNADYKIGVFGLGIDGHTAGIKPNSIATKSQDLAVYYTSDDFERVTITFTAIRQLDTAIIQASGIDKKTIINSLMNETPSYINQPAQILKFVPNVRLYTNNKKEE